MDAHADDEEDGSGDDDDDDDDDDEEAAPGPGTAALVGADLSSDEDGMYLPSCSSCSLLRPML